MLLKAQMQMKRTPEADTTLQLQGLTRRHFLQQCTGGLGGLWLALRASGGIDHVEPRDPARPLTPRPKRIAAKAKRIIYLHMAGAPSQLELFQHKPELAKLNGQDCQWEFLEGRRLAFLREI